MSEVVMMPLKMLSKLVNFLDLLSLAHILSDLHLENVEERLDDRLPVVHYLLIMQILCQG